MGLLTTEQLHKQMELDTVSNILLAVLLVMAGLVALGFWLAERERDRQADVPAPAHRRLRNPYSAADCGWVPACAA